MSFVSDIPLRLRRLRKRLHFNIASVLALLMLVLLPVFAVLQYRWLGKLSESQQERRQTQLQNTTRLMARELNKHFVLLQHTFLLTEEEVAAKSLEKLLHERHDIWTHTANAPLLAQIFYVRKSADSLVIQEFLPDKQRIVPHHAPAVRQRIERILAEPMEQLATLPHYVHEGLSTMVIPIMNEMTPSNFIVLRLDTAYFRTALFLPQATAYFPDKDEAPYQMAIVDSSRIMFTSDTVFTFRAARDASTHSVVGLLPPAQFTLMLLERRLPPQMLNRLQQVQKQNFLPGDAIAPQTMTDDFPFTDMPNPFGGGGGMSKALPPAVVAGMMADSNLASITRMINVPELVIEHGAGKLETQVETLRWRNVAISFGMLLLLAGVIVLLLVLSIRTERLAKQQMQFVAGVSHELRTPITVIRLAGENLSDGLIDDLAMAQMYGDLILKESDKLWGLVERTLEFAGIQAGKRTFEMQALDLTHIIHAAVGDVHLLAKEQGMTLLVEIPKHLPHVQADAVAVRSVLVNLLTNALKYSLPKDKRNAEQENTVLLRAYTTENSTGKSDSEKFSTLVIVVQDYGRGISREDASYIFEPFFRSSDVVQEQISGNGLGLSLVKYIMEAHGGSVAVESVSAHQHLQVHGSTFTLEFPLSHTA